MTIEATPIPHHPELRPNDLGQRPGRAAPILEKVDERSISFQDRIEEYLTRGEKVDPQVLKDSSQYTFGDLARSHYSLAWPDSWYIPSQADFHQYWITAPPAANRYRFGWGESSLFGTSGPSAGSTADGHVFSYSSMLPSDSHDSAFAGVAALFTPSATLSYADVSIDADIVTQSRIWMLLAHHTSNLPTAHIRCTAFAVIWHIDPVTGAWDLIAPFGRRNLVDRSDSGLSGSAIQTLTTHLSGSDLTTRVQVQAGRSYAVGFQAQIDIDVDVRADNGQRYQRQSDDDWKLWADMTCSVPQITIATKVLIP